MSNSFFLLLKRKAFKKNIIERYKTIKNEHQINAEIRDREVRLIGENGEQLGIVSSREALHIAEDSGLDLVKISPNANPPVCKVMNYGKFLFEQKKKAKEAAKPDPDEDYDDDMEYDFMDEDSFDDREDEDYTEEEEEM